MFSPEDLQTAIAVVKEVSGNPDSGIIAELLATLEASVPVKEVRVIASKEVR